MDPVALTLLVLVLLGIFLKLNQLENNMPTIAEVKAAVAAKAEEVKTAILAAVANETTEISAQIQALKDQIAAGTTISQEDLDGLLASVSGIASAAGTAIDSISTSDGA